jgi:hypothetical protein
MAFVAFAIAVWSLVAAVLLKLGRVRPGGTWGWSWVGNLLQGTGLALVGLTIAFDHWLAGGVFWGAPAVVWLALPWTLVLAGVALRVRARRAARTDGS